MAKKVLMIDDDPEIIEAISNILDARGYNVISANDGKDGVAKAKKERKIAVGSTLEVEKNSLWIFVPIAYRTRGGIRR